MTLKETRQSKHLTQNEVAQSAGINRSTYANIEAHRRSPSVALAKRIAKVLGVSWVNLFEEGEEHDD